LDLNGIVLIFESFFLALTRIAGFMAYAPLFGGATVPATVKAGLCFLITFVIYPHISLESLTVKKDLLSFSGLVMAEIIFGIAMGYICNLFFETVKLAGSFFDKQIGFGIVSVADPEGETEVSLTSLFKYYFAFLIFIGINGHHYLLKGLSDSFIWQKLGNVGLPGVKAGLLLSDYTGRMFELSFQIALPLMGSILLATTVLGILSKATPRIQVFMMSFPLRILIGLFTLAILIPALGSYYCVEIGVITENIIKMTRAY
jgi:flagellar biosynthetic protein FliR